MLINFTRYQALRVVIHTSNKKSALEKLNSDLE